MSDAADAPRRLADYPTLTTTLYPKDNLISIFDLVQRSVKQYSDRPCLGEGCVCLCMWRTEHDLLYRESFFSEQMLFSSKGSLIDLV